MRTLYATSFTAKEGMNIVGMPFLSGLVKPALKNDRYAMDAITGATPGNGKLTYIWDGTDQNGTRVPKGKYHFS